MQNRKTKIKMLENILQFFHDYIYYFVACLIQCAFILLPVILKNWDDDLLNCLTYISIQIFVAGILFIIVPWVLELNKISFWYQVFFLIGSGFIAVFRIIKLIPLEFTFSIKLPAQKSVQLEFAEFYNSERQKLLYTLDFTGYDSELRYQSLRERLQRRKTEKVKGDEDEEDDS